ncbi:MAG: divergent PAP2 family protein [Treponema sp.]|jgi:acid phosphatase family membrane protein YuiD|nr:divergent PAP2 family protein [Treponema sp.]
MNGTLSPQAVTALLENPLFLSAISSLFFAQLVKTIIYLLRVKHRKPKDTLKTLIWRTGGMPSSHSSLVASMSASVAFYEGINSSLFVITLMVALVIIRDSLGVRRSSGNQARMLNWLGRAVSEKLGLDYHPVKEVNGHSPLEVVVGVLLGIFIAAAFRFL